MYCQMLLELDTRYRVFSITKGSSPMEYGSHQVHS